jgi:hypothetical protein
MKAMEPYKKQSQLLTLEALSGLFMSEWHLPFQVGKLKHKTLKSLGISISDVNWMLHTVEWRYKLIILEEVPLHVTLQEFMQCILTQDKKQDLLS